MYHVFIVGERYFATDSSIDVDNIIIEHGGSPHQYSLLNGIEVHDLPDDTNIVTTYGEGAYGSPTYADAGFQYAKMQGYGEFEYDHDTGHLHYSEPNGDSVIVVSGKSEDDAYANLAKSQRYDSGCAENVMFDGDGFETIEEWIERKCKMADIPIGETA